VNLAEVDELEGVGTAIESSVPTGPMPGNQGRGSGWREPLAVALRRVGVLFWRVFASAERPTLSELLMHLCRRSPRPLHASEAKPNPLRHLNPLVAIR
jgi:hypothetical protein